MTRHTIVTDLGPLMLVEHDGCLVSVNAPMASDAIAAQNDASSLLLEAAKEIDAYLAGRLSAFSIPLKPDGTAFQQRIWSLMQDIPYGDTCTYGEMADQAGSAARAVGTACGANPILVLIPCHRVVGKAGITGYSGPGGPTTKRLLLDLESRVSAAHLHQTTAEQSLLARRSA